MFKSILLQISVILFLGSCSSSNKTDSILDQKSIELNKISEPIEITGEPIEIADIGDSIKLVWKTSLLPELTDKFQIHFENLDTVINFSTNANSYNIKRKMSFYNQAISIDVIAKTGQTKTIVFPKYENNYSRFFTCKNKYVAHRGLSSLYPENTRIAFEKAAEVGFEYVECDIWLTKDHQWVVIHDETIDRTSDGTGKVSQYSLEELQKFNFGYQKKYVQKFNQQILTLQEFVELCSSRNIKPLIEIKLQNVDEIYLKQMLDIINKILPFEKYAVHTYNSITLESIRKINKEVILGLITNTYNQSHLKYLSNLYPIFYNMAYSQSLLDQPYNKISSNNIFSIFSTGTFVSIWTINDPKYFENLLMNNMFILTDILPAIFK